LRIYPFAYRLSVMDKDIATLLREIKSATAWSEPRIASELGTSQPTVNRILNGQSDCKVATFRAIVDLYQKVCSEQQEQSRRSTDSSPESQPQ
jgi:predicted transcriptional regulator